MVPNRPRSSGSGQPVDPVAPSTRGVRPTLFTSLPRTMPYAGSGTARESNARYRQLIAHGTTGLYVTFDVPTRMGHDSDDPLASGEVGEAGVAIDSIDDMRVLFGGIRLDEVSTSMTVDAPAALLLLLYQLVAEEQGVPADRLRGTIHNDVRMEHVARGPHIFPPTPSLRLTADVLTYCKAEIPKWDTIPVSGHRRAAAGASPAQEIARTLAEGIGPGSRKSGIEAQQAERLAKLRAWRDQDRVDRHLTGLQKAAAGDDNVLYPMKEALSAGATVGEVCDALREIWGTYAPGVCR